MSVCLCQHGCETNRKRKKVRNNGGESGGLGGGVIDTDRWCGGGWGVGGWRQKDTATDRWGHQTISISNTRLMRANFHVFPNQFFVTVSGAEVLQCKIPTRNQTTGKKNLKDYVSDCLKKEKKLFKKKRRKQITPPHGQPCTIFKGWVSISGGWILLSKELINIMAEDSPYITMQHITL